MSNIEALNNITDKDMADILEVWESAVRATHLFLSEEDIQLLKPFVKEGANFVSHLIAIRDEQHTIQAFMGVHDHKIEMLFVRESNRGKGMGKQLINYAIHNLNTTFVDVNEQNEQGNPFPILHMKL